MATGKYEHLFKPLKMAEMPGQAQIFKNTGNADVNRWLNGRDHLEGVELNFSWGFYTGLGDWHPGMDPHVHPYPECLVFVGLDPDRPEYLGAKIQYCLGKELEIHTFDKPIGDCRARRISALSFGHAGRDQPDRLQLFHYFTGRRSYNPVAGRRNIRRTNEAHAEWPGSGIKSPMNSSFGQKRVHISEETVTHGHVNDRYIKPLKPNTMTPALNGRKTKLSTEKWSRAGGSRDRE